MSRTLQIQTARVYLPILQPARYKGLFGGRGSGKSHAFAELMIDCHLEPGQRSVCVREVQLSMKQSVKLLLEDKIDMFGLTSQFQSMDSEIRTPGGGVIIFQGMQNHTSDSIKSLEGYDRAWIEEAQSISERSLKLLRPTIRKERCRFCRIDSKFDETPCLKGGAHLLDPSEIWASWNPNLEKDPIDKLLRVEKPPNSIVIGTTYRDNPWFTKTLRDEMEWDRSIDVEKYNHVWLGGYEKHSEARVFKNWRIEAFETPRNAIFYTGADWGFSVDPATLVRCFEQINDPATGNPWPRKRLCIDYDMGHVGVEVDHLSAFFDGLVCGCRQLNIAVREGAPMHVPPTCLIPDAHGIARLWPIIADSARPETISYMRRHGYPNMEAARKGANSVKEGVIFLQGYDIVIHPRCKHAIEEFTGYSYVRDPQTGQITPILEDKKNHIIDPARYAVEQLRHALVVTKTRWG